MAAVVGSFDIFDTLLARRRSDSREVFLQLEARAGPPGLAVARLDADRRLGGCGQPYKLQDIWREVGRALGGQKGTHLFSLDEASGGG